MILSPPVDDAPAQPASGKPASILIVEDEGVVALHIESQLRKLGYQITGMTARGEEAVRIAMESRPDLVLMDIRLQGDMDGISTAQGIHEQAGIPVIFLTAYAEDSLLQRAKIANPFGYILKPFRDRELKSAIEMALYHHALMEQVRSGGERLRQVVENMPVMINAMDDQGRIVLWNRECERVTGFSAAEIVGNPGAIELLYPDPAVRACHQDHLAALGGHYRDFEWESTCKDGTVRTVAWHSVSDLVPIPGWRTWAIGVDITERKHAEAALQQALADARQRGDEIQMLFSASRVVLNERDFNSLIRSLCDMCLKSIGAASGAVGLLPHGGEAETVICLDAYGGICRFNPLTKEEPLRGLRERAFQQGSADFRNGLDCSALPGQEGGITSALHAPLALGAETLGVLAFFNKPGGFLQRDSGLASAFGELISIALLNDRTLRSLKQSEERYRRLLESSPDAIFIQSDGRFVFINSAGLRLFHARDANQILQRPIMESVHPEHRMAAEKLIGIQSGKRLGSSLVELKIIRLDGGVVDVELAATEFVFDNRPAVQVIARDISERKFLESKLLHRQRMETIGILAGGIAHDLNNALSPVVMGLPLVREQCIDPETLTLIDNLSTNLERASSIVKQLLTFDKGLPGERMRLRMTELLQGTMRVVRRSFPQSIQINYQPGVHDRPVLGDATQLHLVFLNLCVNARDSMSTGGSLTVSIENQSIDDCFAQMNPDARPGEWVSVCLSDTGAGLSREALDHVFEPFFAVREMGQGTGLGLATAMNIVKGHGGFIQVSSEVGKGTQFKVFLPAAPDAVAPAPVTAAASPMGREEGVLVVDDEPGFRYTTEQILLRHNYKVFPAGDGAEALAVYLRNESAIGIVLMDIDLPVMDGVASIRALRQINPRIPVMAISSQITPDQQTELEALSVQAFLSKPFTAERMLTALRTLLDVTQ
jgi:PAS domain S-box-containing protein